MNDILRFSSISEVHRMFNIGKPNHPLISVVRHHKDMNLNFEDNVRMSVDLYIITLKETIKGAIKYGRNSYDFEEGTLLFSEPGQVWEYEGNTELDTGGWVLLFHPNLIRKSPLAKTISNYRFFNYDIHEALHLSKKERMNLEEIVFNIEHEINQNIDKHSQDLIIHHLEAILKYGLRYYERQFHTRTNLSKDHLSKFTRFLRNYFEKNQQIQDGIPTVEMCGAAMHMSGKYLSDLLKAETGKTLKEHIQLFIVEKAKISLLNSKDSVSEIAYSLGFSYPQHFSKLFKVKTGMSPREYRNLQ